MSDIEKAMRRLKEARWYLNRVKKEWNDDYRSIEYRELEDTIEATECAMNSLDNLGDFE